MKLNTVQQIVEYLRKTIRDDDYPFSIDIKYPGRFICKFGDENMINFYDNSNIIKIYTKNINQEIVIPRNTIVLSATLICLEKI